MITSIVVTMYYGHCVPMSILWTCFERGYFAPVSMVADIHLLFTTNVDTIKECRDAEGGRAAAY